MEIYKIQNAKTGMYSTGGAYPSWSKNGKIWRTMGHLHSHLRQCIDYHNPYNRDCVIVTLEVVESVKEKVSVVDYIIAKREFNKREEEKIKQKKKDAENNIKRLKDQASKKLTAEERHALGL